MGPILKVDNLSKVFLRGGQQPVTSVKNVSFELMPGECLGVLGEERQRKNDYGKYDYPITGCYSGADYSGWSEYHKPAGKGTSQCL